MQLRHLRFVVFGLLLAAPMAGASVVEQMSFEEATINADVVVLGTIREKPDLALRDPKSGEVVRLNRIHVERYLKGSAADEISLVLLGGKFIMQTPKGPEEQWVDYGGEPTLPGVGTTVLLFLKPFHSPNAFVLASVSHGIREVVPSAGNDERTVSLLFRHPELMPAAALQNYESLKAAGGNVSRELVGATVTVSELKNLVDRANTLVPKRTAVAAPGNSR